MAVSERHSARGRLMNDEMSSPAIAAANAAVNNLQPRGVGAKKRGSYMKLDEMKIKIGKYSSENGVSAAARHF